MRREPARTNHLLLGGLMLVSACGLIETQTGEEAKGSAVTQAEGSSPAAKLKKPGPKDTPKATDDTKKPGPKTEVGAGEGELAEQGVVPIKTDPEAEKLVLDWLQSQREADFARYLGAYDDAFVGVRRSGDKVREFDKEGWKKDRRTAFVRGFYLAASDIQYARKGDRIVVSFEQVWSSGSYADTGAKVLELVTDDKGKLKIVREEMLSSQKIPGPLGIGLSYDGNARVDKERRDQLAGKFLGAGTSKVVLRLQDLGAPRRRVRKGDEPTVAQRAILELKAAGSRGKEWRPFLLDRWEEGNGNGRDVKLVGKLADSNGQELVAFHVTRQVKDGSDHYVAVLQAQEDGTFAHLWAARGARIRAKIVDAELRARVIGPGVKVPPGEKASRELETLAYRVTFTDAKAQETKVNRPQAAGPGPGKKRRPGAKRKRLTK